MLAAGTTLGPYKLAGLIGAGGMGEVYRAHDTRLGRDVAVKVIPAALTRDADRIRRFEQEARAAGALNHPNVCAVYDLGTHDGAPYVVMELLEGSSLRERLRAGAVPVRKAVDWIAQAAHGLAVAHAKGIVHRDLKPENLYLTKDGRVKVLDFGLAKLTRPEVPGPSGDPTVSIAATETGSILGTVGYMSPEQVKGEAADARSDLFALGAILYELVTGQRAFHGATYVETLNAILHGEPGPLAGTGRDVPPALEVIVRRCLEKNPAERFQSASDLAFDLENLSGSSGAVKSDALVLPPLVKDRRLRLGIAAAFLTGIVLTGGGVLLHLRRQAPVTDAGRLQFTQVTFERGEIGAARFSPDGQTVIHEAGWGGRPLRLFETRPGFGTSRSLGLDSLNLVGISRDGMLAVRRQAHWSLPGVVAEVSMMGGTPRALQDSVLAADWQPGTSILAVARRRGPDTFLELPPGRVIYKSPNWLTGIRFSRDGRRLALEETMLTRTVVVDTSGHVLAESGEMHFMGSPVWSANGREVWFSASQDGANWELRALSLEGRQRVVACFPGAMMLTDLAPDGRALMVRSTIQAGILARRSPASPEREVGALMGCNLADMSADGTKVLYSAYPGFGQQVSSVYLREVDGAAPIRLGEGVAAGLSPDGRWALAFQVRVPPQFVVFPTGAGDSIVLRHDGIEWHGESAFKWMPDSRRIVFAGSQPGRPVRSFVQDLEGGAPQPLTPEGVVAFAVSPDGQQVLINGDDGWSVLRLGDETPRRIWQHRPSIRLTGILDTWTADGRWVYASSGDSSGIAILRRNVESGEVVPWTRINIPDMAGLDISTVEVGDVGGGYAIGYSRVQSDLFVVEGLK